MERSDHPKDLTRGAQRSPKSIRPSNIHAQDLAESESRNTATTVNTRHETRQLKGASAPQQIAWNTPLYLKLFQQKIYLNAYDKETQHLFSGTRVKL